MSTNLSRVSVAQSSGNGKGTCPKCGSALRVQWSWVGGRGDRLVARCTMEHAPSDGNGGRWCPFGVELEGHEWLFA